MNKKIFAVVSALSLMISGVLCGCNADKDTESDEKSSSSSSKSNSASTDNEKEESSTKDVSSKDKIYTDYLSKQKLCTISKNFKILEAGTARDNPNGLAGAVKHDFDGDKVDDLVTFTFEKNSTNGEDIRVDLLKVSGNKLTVADSKYLTELADLSSQPKKNTIYFDWTATAEIITSEYNDNLYFGCLFSEACDEFNRGGDSFGGFGVFTIENDKITEQSVGYTESALDCEVIAKLLPPSSRNTADTEGLVDAENRIIAYSGTVNGEEKGLYASADEAVSAMLNEFGLNMQFKYDDESSTHSDADPDYHWISKNGSTLKTILCTEYLMSYQSDNSFMNGYDNYYAGIKLVLNSDLETLLGNDTPFTEPFADELALYEDILKYPYYYHEIWDTYAQLSNGSPLIGFNYCIADINRDDKYELIITSYADSNQLPLHCSVIMPDLTTTDIDGQGETRFLDNGIVSVTEVGGAMSPVHYYDINTNTSWTANDVRQEDMKYIRSIWQDNGDICLEGAEAEKKEQELSNGSLLMLNEVFYNLYSDNFSELIIVEDINEITYTWQKAYLSAIDEFKVVGNAPYGTESLLLDISE